MNLYDFVFDEPYNYLYVDITNSKIYKKFDEIVLSEEY